MKKNFSVLFRWVMFFTSTLFFFYEYVLRVSPGVMGEELRASFHINAELLGFMSAAFFLAYAFLQIPVGIIFDKFSTRKVLFLACLVCALGTIIFACTTQFWLGLLGRLLGGLGAGFGFVGVLKVAEQWLPPQRFAFISGLLLSLGFLGGMLSGNVLQIVVNKIGWSDCLLNLGFVGIALSFLLLFVIQDSPRLKVTQRKIDSAKIIKGVLSVVKNRSIWLSGLIGFCLYAPTSAFAELWGKPYLITVLHLTSQQAVFAASTILLGWAVGAPIVGMRSDVSRNRRAPILLGGVLAFLCATIVMYVPGLNYFLVCTLLFLCGIFSSTEVLIFPYTFEVSTKGFGATGIAAANMITVLGGAVTQPLIGWLLDYYWTGAKHNGVHIYSPQAYEYAYIVIPVLLCTGGLLSLFLQKTKYEKPTKKIHSLTHYISRIYKKFSGRLRKTA